MRGRKNLPHRGPLLRIKAGWHPFVRGKNDKKVLNSYCLNVFFYVFDVFYIFKKKLLVKNTLYHNTKYTI
jgi:hypothetical protein